MYLQLKTKCLRPCRADLVRVMKHTWKIQKKKPISIRIWMNVVCRWVCTISQIIKLRQEEEQKFVWDRYSIHHVQFSWEVNSPGFKKLRNVNILYTVDKFIRQWPSHIRLSNYIKKWNSNIFICTKNLEHLTYFSLTYECLVKIYLSMLYIWNFMYTQNE